MLKMRDLPNEAEIISNWNIGIDKPVVSIICTAYNHEQYIADAIESFLKQKTSFPFEIIIHDDASTDQTPLIVSEYARNYPEIIKTIIQKKNVYSKDKHGPLRNCLNSSKGDFIAICEGDDFWINDKKLKLQYERLLQEPRLAMAIMPGYAGSSFAGHYEEHCYHGNKEKIFMDPSCILNVGGQFAPTASYLVKRDTLEFFNNKVYKDISVSDLFIELFSIRDGGIVYLPIFSSFYRTQTSGSWSKAMAEGGIDSYEKYASTLKRVIGSDSYLSELDWNYKFSYLYLGISLIALKSGNKNIFLKYRDKSQSIKCRKKLSFHIFYFLSFFPGFLKLVTKLHK